MNGIFYKNTYTKIPGCIDTLHETNPLGYAYESDDHFIHLYGKNRGINVISVGLTVIEKKQGTLEDWVVRVFGAKDINPLNLSIGHSVKGVWRPALYYANDINNALKIDTYQQRSTEQALRILIEKLDDIFLYVEPDQNGLCSYGHKSRELLILACTEVENMWTSTLQDAQVIPSNGRVFTTNDYVKLLPKLFLREYQISFKNYSVRKFQPFINWDTTRPTQSLAWYDAYNKTKHDRNNAFSYATLENVMDAIAANIIMFCVKYSPYSLFESNTSLSSLINQHFEIKLINSDLSSYYIPKFLFPSNIRNDLFIFDPYSSGYAVPWNVQNLII
ncbi:hypothetical protein [Acinetobacter sp. AKBS16]|uniref:hypothetical protein n=1 Tax=Acinetobacter sp. AKBS16 TaxID=2072504 RepID=UPI000CCF59C4|nr:hypothetical protein [Acinetobacter sp. AKBS16]MDC5321638.1 hypothetical protein [Acinetobacter baumannii]PNW17721.1 hypothetical protein C1642_07915 [Acinetobacter sp. AKBS16]